MSDPLQADQSGTYEISRALKATGLSVTAPRIAVFRYLKDRGATSRTELIKNLSSAMDRASVYRVLAVFMAEGIVQEIAIGGQRKLELTDRFHMHHHHLSCIVCGTVITFGSTRLEESLQGIARLHHFEELGHQIEITGRCARCQA